MEDASPEMLSLFAGALELATPEERRVYLDKACAGDVERRARLEELLQAHEKAGGFLPPDSPDDDLTACPEPAASERPGVVIGPYKLVEQIGEGGMGTVWMAQQTDPVKRVVALKLIKAGMDSKQVIARFEAERQALALMDHPNIAKVLDADTTSAGRPYFVMDLVKGVPITKYCDEHHLTPRLRLELFMPVCQAVQHAHQKGVIHRDLKPSNVLVALYDGRPVPKVIDFGVAKAAGQPLTEHTLVTGLGNIVGTLEYMSPEQAELNQLDIDTRSDIYSLGVLLYELLAGSPPFSRKDLEKAGMMEMLRVIREQEPSKPSTKLSTAEGLPTLAANRGTEPAKLTKLVRGELDWIVMKALEKDRGRRYETANGFAMDVQRYLADEPVAAGPPSLTYRLRKFVRRNRRAVIAASVIVLLLIGGIVGTTLGLFRALSAEEQAISAGKLATNNETKARSAVNRYFTLVSEETLLDMPGFQPLREKLLEEARKYYEELLQQRSNDPVVQAELAVAYFRMGEIYQATGKGAEFIAAFQTGFELVEQLVHENPGDTDLHRRLAGFWTGHRRLHLASTTNLPKSNGTAILQKVAIQWQRFVDDNPNVPEFQSDLAAVFGHLSELHYQKPQELISWQKKALAIRTKLVSAYPSRPLYRADQAVSHVLLGIFSSRVGKRDEAVKHLRAAIGFLDELATEFTKVPIYREGMGIAKRFLSSHVQAGEYEKLWRESLQLYGDLVAEFPTVPSYHHGHAESSFYVGRILASAKQLQEAERAYQLSWQLYGKLLEGFPEYGDYLWGVRESHAGLIKLLNSSGRTQDAITVSGQAIEFYEKLHAKHPKHIGIQADLVRVYVLRSGALQKSGQPGETEKALRRAVDLARPLVTATPTLPRYRTQFFELTHELDRLLRKSGQLKQAEELVREAITTLEKEIGDGLLSTAHHHLSSLLTQANRLEEAEVHLRKALEVAEKEAIKSPKSADAWGRIAHHSRFLAWHLKSLKRFAEAERVFVNALNGYYKAAAKSTGEAVYGNRYFAADTHWNLADVIRPQSRPKEEEAEYRKGVELFFTLPAKSLTDGAGRDTANRCVNSLVELLSAAKRLPEAEAILKQSIGFYTRLSAEMPKEPAFRQELAARQKELTELRLKINSTKQDK